MAIPGVVLRPLHGASPARRHAEPPDGELLRTYTAGDPDAFAALVRRHGRMVLNVCRNVLVHEEDAFQATFLVLAKKAAGLRSLDSLAGWLHGVARRSVLRARRDRDRRRAREARAPRPTSPPAGVEHAWRELQAILDDELARLPEKFRTPFVLCCLEGHSKSEAARLLGWPEGTVSGRMAEARRLLKGRLARRGVSLSAVLFGLAVAGGAARGTLPSATSASAAAGALALSVLRGMLFAKFAYPVVGLVVVLGALVAGLGAARCRSAAGPHDVPTMAPPSVPAKAEVPRVDRFGDPLPDGAAARLGTTRFRHDLTIHSVVFAPDGKSVWAVGGNSTARALSRWDVATGRELPAPRPPQAVAAAASPDGRTLATSDRDGITLWDVATGAELRRCDGQPGAPSLASSPDGRSLAAAGDGSVRVWDVATARGVSRCKGPLTSPYAVAYAPDDRGLAVLDGNTLRTYDAAIGDPRWIATGRVAYSAIAFAPDGKAVASAGEDGSMRLTDAATGKELRSSAAAGERALRALAFAPDGKTVATGSFDGVLCLWDAATCKEVRRWQAAPALQGVAFAPDGRTLATATPLGERCPAVERRHRQARPPPGGAPRARHVPVVRAGRKDALLRVPRQPRAPLGRGGGAGLRTIRGRGAGGVRPGGPVPRRPHRGDGQPARRCGPPLGRRVRQGTGDARPARGRRARRGLFAR